MKKILVAYASKYGSTKEIASKITERLKAGGNDVQLMDAQEVKDLHNYDAMIIGSGVYIGRWIKTAVKLVKKNTEALSRIPVWFFSSGPTGEDDPLKETEGWIFPKALEKETAAIKPKDKALFKGAIYKEKLSGIHKWMVEKIGAPEKDNRQWDKIDDWAKTISKELL